MDVTLLYFDGCPSWQLADERLRVLRDELHFDLRYQKVETPQEAQRLSFRGSPTILVDGHDPFADDEDPVGLSCRIYQTPEGAAGAPSLEQFRKVIPRGPEGEGS